MATAWVGTQRVYGGTLTKGPMITAFLTPHLRSPLLPPLIRREVLREQLLTTVELLFHDRADLVGDGFIGDYVALRWLEWCGGTLRLTAAGDIMCAQMRERLQ